MRILRLAVLSALIPIITVTLAFAQSASSSNATASPASVPPLLFVVLDNPAPVFMPPVLVAQPKPDFSLCGKLRNKSLRVAITLEVDLQGLPQHITVQTKSSNKCVDQAVVAAVQAYRFTPAQQNGKIVSSPIGLVIDASGSSPTEVSLPILLKSVDTQFPANMPNSVAVRVYLQVGTDGIPRNVRVEQSVNPGIDRAAIAAVSQYRFWPSMKNGRPTQVDLHIDVSYTR